MIDKELLFKASILIDDLLKVHFTELFNDADVQSAQIRISSNGGLLHYSATVQNDIKDHLTSGA
jgi:hypothetical protein